MTNNDKAIKILNKLNSKCGTDLIYPKSIDLSAALLEGRVDYIFAYSSVAEQFGFFFINLPDRINLSNPTYAHEYSGVTMTVAGKEGGVSLVKGTPIEFAVAIPRNSTNKEAANIFIEILTSPEGEKILGNCGLISC